MQTVTPDPHVFSPEIIERCTNSAADSPAGMPEQVSLPERILGHSEKAGLLGNVHGSDVR